MSIDVLCLHLFLEKGLPAGYLAADTVSRRVGVSPLAHNNRDLYHLAVGTLRAASRSRLTRICLCVLTSVVPILAVTIAELLAVALGQAVSARTAIE